MQILSPLTGKKKTDEPTPNYTDITGATFLKVAPTRRNATWTPDKHSIHSNTGQMI